MPDFLNPQDIISRLDIKSGMRIADFGVGSGFFTILLARLVGDTGGVTALDVQKDVLELLKVKARRENVLNIDFVWANLELPRGSKLDDGSQDVVLVANVLFQADDRMAIIREAMRVLKPGGALVAIEWEEQDPPPGPPRNLRIPKRTLKEYCESAGLSLYRELAAGSSHYGFLFKK